MIAGVKITFRFHLLIGTLDLSCGLYGDDHPQAEYGQGAESRNPSAKTGYLRNHCKKSTAFYKQQPHGDEHPGQAETKDRHQNHAEPHTAQGNRGQQQYQCRRARQQAAGYAQAQQGTPGHRRSVGAGGQMGMTVSVMAVGMVVVMRMGV